MKYLDINSVDNQDLKININLDDSLVNGSLILWTIYKDGHDTPVAVFDNTDGYAQATIHKYYHKLSLNLSELVFDENLIDETSYNLEGLFNGTIVYKGKFQTTSKSLNNFSVNENKYVKQTTSNNYTILN